MAALGGRGDEEEEKFLDKIVKNVIKEVVIDKNPIKKDHICISEK